jgi:carbamoyltransferase
MTSFDMNILGISAFYHDSAAALVKNGEVIAASQQERFSRCKHDADFPIDAIIYCLKAGGLTFEELDSIVFYDKPLLKFERLLETYLRFTPNGLVSFQESMPVWIKEKVFQVKLIRDSLATAFNIEKECVPPIRFSEHHHSHIASAFYPSPFEKAAILTVDGVGEWATTSIARGNGSQLEFLREIHFPHSIGLLYSAFTYYIGFRVNSGEYKLMGLAPYGEPRYVNIILDNLLDLKDDGSFRLDMKFFSYCTGKVMTSKKFHNLFDGKPRDPDSEKITQKHMDIAASIQKVIEEAVIRLAKHALKITNMKDLCMAGGVALNCVANGRILRESGARRLWVQPAAGDAGGALGAAFAGYHNYHNQPRKVLSQKDAMQGSYLGPSFSDHDVIERLHNIGAQFETLSDDELMQVTSDALVQEKVVGWFQGRMEFGPRALGNRSILGNPLSSKTQLQLNKKVKFRESFRPFAPAVLVEQVGEWFNLEQESPYMLIVDQVRKERCRTMTEEQNNLFGIDKLNQIRSDIPAVTHVDLSARIQTVDKTTNSRFYSLIQSFGEKTGCPILVNTSFNIRGEPIVCTPEDAFHCFMGTGIDVLVIGNCFMTKAGQSGHLSGKNLGKFLRN